MIRHARILQPDGDFQVGDACIGGGKILEVASTLDSDLASHQEVDASGLTLLPQVVNWMSTAVTKAYKIPNKGAIAPGQDADLVL